MDLQLKESVKRILIRLDDERREVQSLTPMIDYPLNAKLERVHDSLETAEKYLKDLIGDY